MLFSKCRAKLFCGLLLLALLLSACDPQSVGDPTQPGNSSDPSSEVSAPMGEDVNYPLLAENQPGVLAFLGACPSSTADGYYCVIGEKIKFFDVATEAMVTVCAQPGCSHSDETCQAWIGAVSCFREYNGQIYANREDGGSIQFIRKDLTDGGITVLAEWKATDTVSYVPGNIMISKGGAIAYLHSQFSREEGENFRMDSVYTVWHIDLTTGEKRELFSGGSGLTFVWALSKAHAVVLYCAAEQGLSLEEFNAEYGSVNAVNFELRLYDADFNHYTVLTVMDEGIASGCAYGKEAVYVEGDEVFLVNVDTGESRRLLTLKNIIG